MKLSVRASSVVLAVAAAIALPSAARSMSESEPTRAAIPRLAAERLSPRAPTAVARVQANSTSYTDSTGEAAGIPDITTVVVQNDDSGFVTVRVNVPNRPTLSGEQLFALFLDTDRNANTGGSSGYDYIIEAHHGQFALFGWNGSEFRSGPPMTTLSYAWSSGATVRINVAELANTKSFGFVALVTDAPNTSSVTDIAPDSASYSYNVVVTTIKPPAGNRVAITGFSADPRVPAAGESFFARVAVRRVGRSGQFRGVVYCEGRLNGREIQDVVVAVGRGYGACSWSIPRNAVGKRLTGAIGVEEGGPAVYRRFAYRVTARGAVLVVEATATSPSSGPASGRRFQFAAGIKVTRGGFGDRIKRGTVDCVASIGGRSLKATREHVEPKAGILCQWNIPSGTARQLLTGYALVSSDGGTKRINFRYRID